MVYALTIIFLFELLSLGLTITSTGLTRLVASGLFWFFVLASLFVIMGRKVWSATEWLSFAAFATSIIAGVLFSLHAVSDEIGVGMVVIGLLLVTAAVTAMQQGKGSVTHRPPVAPREMFFGLPTGNTFHRSSCRMVSGKKEVVTFADERAARAAGLKPCRFCF